MKRSFLISLAAALALGACSDQQGPTSNPDAVPDLGVSSSQRSTPYVIVFESSQASAVATAIDRAGGKVRKLSARAGLATAFSDVADFADRVRRTPGVRSVVQDMVVQWVPKEPARMVVEPAAGGGTPTGSTERFFPIQWALQAIHAPEAWETGALGRGARVAIVDGGIWDQHVDIASNLDAQRSTSFVPGVPFNFDNDASLFWHGTHVAGIVAAADNNDNLGVIGVAPKATLIGVKVSDNGSGTFGQLIDGLIYAADRIKDGGAGADIINMSLGATFSLNSDPRTTALIDALNQATTYAHAQGALLVASAGNGDNQGHGINHDNGNYITIPAQSDHVLGVSALTPIGYALGSTNFDLLASYSNFGTSIVDFSGPGGDTQLQSPNGNDANCTLAINPAPPLSPSNSITQPCYVFDMVVSSCRGTTTRNVCFASGTSMSAPAVSGVAALIVGKQGSMNPDALEARLAASADDLGETGVDAIYGRGRVNAFRAVQ
jgi:lantibiotic leader peptide-processing serine protease